MVAEDTLEHDTTEQRISSTQFPRMLCGNKIIRAIFFLHCENDELFSGRLPKLIVCYNIQVEKFGELAR